MRPIKQFLTRTLLFAFAVILTTLVACNNSKTDSAAGTAIDPVATNITAYTHVWDEIMNKGKVELFNDSNFTKDVVMHVMPADIVGIDSARIYYSNYLTGFSNINFTIKDVFGMGNKLVKHWKFTGKHTGVFFGIPATGKDVDVEGVTLVRMENGKIAEERDFFDNLEFMNQLGIIPR